MDVKSLSEMLGHSDVQITLNRYVHPSMDIKRKYIDSLSAFMVRFMVRLDKKAWCKSDHFVHFRRLRKSATALINIYIRKAAVTP